MASASSLPIKLIAFTTALVLGASASRINLRTLIINTFTGPGMYSRIAAALLVLANLKNVPWAWHYRVFQGILYHCLFNKPNIPLDIAPSTLFLPVITSSYSPLLECDYNFHKSNSTYFSDLDVTRSHLICALIQPGIEKLQHNAREKLVLDKEGKPVLGKWSIMLGGVMTTFKREIGMYQGYEMWSRLLAWDRKWVYIVTHFVKKGAVKPKEYILTDGSWFGKGKKYQKVNQNGHASEATGEDLDEKAIFASAISKYVIKLGRLTIHPEVSLEAAGMLPPKPGGWATMTNSGESTPETLEVVETDDAAQESSTGDEWNWKRIEEKNNQGLKLVEHFAALDGLHGEFSGSKEPALGRYRDFLW
ncbi:uncharacterized protein LY89DRAFT_653422 [Mollisia scopiformis]|uniref:Capsule polysaccharide biosynthesis protein n=1 Tax=Mollisia scopiformis TaxID=149040 RepID=A0A194WVB4_MOLSC|nr:uncharacterized protein LY89DRAFT_653422 [Mollisia scopiformis]KUJ11908.1 hypothetical protein LY89DRAFT_653422 [Mollisia scopiformis]